MSVLQQAIGSLVYNMLFLHVTILCYMFVIHKGSISIKFVAEPKKGTKTIARKTAGPNFLTFPIQLTTQN